MFDKDKLDSFFENTKSPSKKQSETLKRAKIIRIYKLALPSIAAAIIGLLLIVPSLKDVTNDIAGDITKPKLDELEKLHVENTVFHITDADNKVSSFKTSNIDETSPGSKLIKLTAPEGTISTKNDEQIKIGAKIGYYNQTTNMLDLKEKTNVSFSNGMDLSTEEIIFDFSKSMGYSNTPVNGTGNLGDLKSEGLEFFPKTKVINLTGISSISIKNGTEEGDSAVVTANKSIAWHQAENKIEATGKAKVLKDKIEINADKIIGNYNNNGGKTSLDNMIATNNIYVSSSNMKAYGDKLDYDIKKNDMILKGAPAKIETSKGMIEASESIQYIISENKAIAIGNVKAEDGKNVINANKIIAYFNNVKENADIKKIEIIGNISVTTPEATINADEGEYLVKEGVVKLFNNVTISQNGNSIKGDYAETDLVTGISKLTSKKSGGQVSGTFKEK